MQYNNSLLTTTPSARLKTVLSIACRVIPNAEKILNQPAGYKFVFSALKRII
jgi:hypothetical protein